MSDNKNLQDKGWASMADTLERELPQKKKRRPFFWLFFAGIIGMALVAYSYQEKSIDEDVVYANKSTETQAVKTKPVPKIQTDNGKITAERATPSAQSAAATSPVLSSPVTSSRTNTTIPAYEKGKIKNQSKQNTKQSNPKNTTHNENLNVDENSKTSFIAEPAIEIKQARATGNEIATNIISSNPLPYPAEETEELEEAVTNAVPTSQEEVSMEEIEVVKEQTEEKTSSSIEPNDDLGKSEEPIQEETPEIEPVIENKNRNHFFPFLMIEGMHNSNYGNGYAFGGGVGFGNEKASLYIESAYGKLNYQSSYTEPTLAEDNVGIINSGGEPDPTTGFEAEDFMSPDYSTLLSAANAIDIKIGTRKSIFRYLEMDLGLKYRKFLSVSNVKAISDLDLTEPFVNEYILDGQLDSEGALASYDIAPEIYLNVPLSHHWRLGIGYSHGLKNMVQSGEANFPTIARNNQEDSFYNRYFSGKLLYSF